MFRIFSKKNGKSHPRLVPPIVVDQTPAERAIRDALEACDSHLLLTKTAKDSARRMRDALDGLTPLELLLAKK